MTPRSSLSVVIPAYNEEARIEPTLRAVHAYLSDRGLDGEVVVVDDGSADRTSAILGRLAREIPGLRPVRFERNHGKGFAVREGVLRTTKAYVLFCDADQSTPIEEVERLWAECARGADVAIASRSLADSAILVPQPLLRRAMGRVFNGLLQLRGLRGIRDTQCGFKLFPRAAALDLFRSLRTSGFAFDVELLLRARRRGLRIAEVPVRWRDDRDSRVRPGRDSLKMLLEVFRLRGVR